MFVVRTDVDLGTTSRYIPLRLHTEGHRKLRLKLKNRVPATIVSHIELLMKIFCGY